MDFQTILVLLIILGALLYVGNRAFKKLRAFSSDSSGSGCETGCGKCSAESKVGNFAKLK